MHDRIERPSAGNVSGEGHDFTISLRSILTRAIDLRRDDAILIDPDDETRDIILGLFPQLAEKATSR